MTPEEEDRIRADERERCAAVADGFAQDLKEISGKLIKLSQGRIASHFKTTDPRYAEICTIIAAALRSGTDTDYVCVRREELESIKIMLEAFPLTEFPHKQALEALRSLLKEKE